MAQSSLETYLATQPFFAGLNPAYITGLAQCAKERQLESGQFLFNQGERAQEFYLIRDGRITIEIPAITGPPLPIQSLEAGQILGWSWLIPPYRWSFQARAEAPTILLEFDGEDLRSRCEADAAFGYAILKRVAALMSERLEVARQRLMAQWTLPPGFA